jgi:hypothetical protein
VAAEAAAAEDTLAVVPTVTAAVAGVADGDGAHWDYQRGKFVLGKYLQLGYICQKNIYLYDLPI